MQSVRVVVLYMYVHAFVCQCMYAKHFCMFCNIDYEMTNINCFFVDVVDLKHECTRVFLAIVALVLGNLLILCFTI